MSPGLYDPQVETLIRESLEHRWKVEFRDASNTLLPLEVLDCELTMDVWWSPYVQGTVTAVVPPDQATLDALDPRRIVKCTVSAGYVLPGGVVNVKPVAALYLASRTVNRPDNTISMSVQGTEYLLARVLTMNNVTGIPGFNWGSTTPAREAVNSCLYAMGYAFGTWYPIDGSGWDYVNARQDTGWAGDIRWDGTEWIDEQYSGISVGPEQNPQDIARDIADRIGARFWCDETGIWHLLDYPTLSSSSVHQLKVGATGTITGSELTLERTEEWANAVVVNVTWPGQVGEPYVGEAYVSSGPHSVSAAPLVGLFQERQVKAFIAFSQLQVMAGARLRMAMAQGRSSRLDAVAAYWLRPGDTVTLQLPLGPQERHLVSAVTFSLPAGSMSVTTQLPDTSTVTIGG